MHNEIVDEIRAWHRKRCFVMEMRKRADLALGASLRTWLGWRRDLEKDQADRIKDLAAKLIDCGEKIAKGKPHNLSDTEEWKEYGDIILASIAAREPTDKMEAKATKEMERLAKLLPVWAEFAEPVRGFGARSLAVIIGETGDLSNYASHSKVWKRMGVAVMDGVRQGGLRKASNKEDWIAHGYSPLRRSRMFVIGDALIKSNGDGKYRQCYLARKEYERARAQAIGLIVAPAAKIPAKRKNEFMSDGHIHHRAQRYMEKRLLRDLWQAWRRAEFQMAAKPNQIMPDASIADAPQGAGEAMGVLPTAWADRLAPPRMNAA